MADKESTLQITEIATLRCAEGRRRYAARDDMRGGG